VLLCAAKPALPQPAEPGHGLLAGLRQPTVLLVEDDRFLQHVLQQQFARIGLQVDLAPDGQAALACWMERRHELVLTDINVPLLSGIELTRQIVARAGAEHRDVVVVGQSADTAEALHALARESGMREVLAKPVGDDTIRRIIVHYFN
jgi:two-component system capsular synthesis sensor histidine kinase RcsC